MAENKTKTTPRRTKESTKVERRAKTNTTYVMGMINSMALGRLKDHWRERLTVAADLPPDSNAAK
jgi:hypothetical protein